MTDLAKSLLTIGISFAGSVLIAVISHRLTVARAQSDARKRRLEDLLNQLMENVREACAEASMALTSKKQTEAALAAKNAIKLTKDISLLTKAILPLMERSDGIPLQDQIVSWKGELTGDIPRGSRRAFAPEDGPVQRVEEATRTLIHYLETLKNRVLI